MTDLLLGGVELVHLALHALADMSAPHESYFQLANRDHLTATTLLNLNPTGELPIGLAVLIGCTTSLTGTDYDEAFSLSTTLLVVGARSVVGSLWSVPENRNTVYLSYHFHRNLAAGTDPAESLRQAQLWMIDPTADTTMLPSTITALPEAAGPKENVIEWAVFQHMGV